MLSTFPNSGKLAYLIPTTPAAGAQWGYVMPAYYRYKICAIRHTLVTSAAVANRYPGFTFNSPAGLTIHCHGHTAIPASTPTTVTAWAGLGVDAALSTIRYNFSLPQDLYLNGGDSITTNMLNIQAADQIGDSVIYVQAWALPAA